MFEVVRERLLGAGEKYDLVSFGDKGDITLYFKTNADDAASATVLALGRFQELLTATSLPALTPYAVHTYPAGTRPAPKLMGTKEVADILDKTKARVSQLKNSAGFPRPVADLHMGPVYLEADVLEYREARDSTTSRGSGG
ncbi:hypothetical protein GCM10010168_22020 [Actinoplanes ianthinogenes]|uniref:DNA-binding protein n=1 Tax=Actinoplanes ianthinogenes TaxID=122358 RepID=A0ABM7M893_9ACTN|nr:hypothetical protein Aiant_85000 [Actinoplanes ianthinogenes]GGR04543.1 hypothetical protein GCM10010168_22020 [Actinoplanes ianthinogenes]